MNCSPNNKINDKISCFSYSELLEIAKTFNEYIKKENLCNKNVCVIKKEIPLHQTKAMLWKSIYKRFYKLCKTESCWTNLDFIKTMDEDLYKKLKFFTFKPLTTKTSQSWLSTQNINEVLQQYELNYKNTFQFLGAQPADISRITDLLFKNKKYYGIIFNTDTHDKPGKHWVAAFIDTSTKTIDYFDSLGKLCNNYIKNFFDKYFKDYTFNYNKVKHQIDDYNCGIYASFFIIKRLSGFTLKEINNKIISKNAMDKYREILFRRQV